MDERIIEKLAQHDTKIESIERRLEACEETTRALNALTQSIAKMDVSLTATTDAVKELKKDVVALKDVPTKRYEAVIIAIVTAIAGAVVGFLINGLI